MCEGVQVVGLYGFEMFVLKDDLLYFMYSFMFYEYCNGVNLLCVQIDSVNQLFDVNCGGCINFGLIVKLCMLIMYLQIVFDLYVCYVNLLNVEFVCVKFDLIDGLLCWVFDYLLYMCDCLLQVMFDVFVECKYLVSLDVFYMGGGVQVFFNFEKLDNGCIMMLYVVFEYLVNLVFVWLMCDIVYYEMLQVVGLLLLWFNDFVQCQYYLQ